MKLDFSLTWESQIWQSWAHFPAGQPIALRRSHRACALQFSTVPTAPCCLPNTMATWQAPFLIVITLLSVSHPAQFIHLHHLPGTSWHEFAPPPPSFRKASLKTHFYKELLCMKKSGWLGALFSWLPSTGYYSWNPSLNRILAGNQWMSAQVLSESMQEGLRLQKGEQVVNGAPQPFLTSHQGNCWNTLCAENQLIGNPDSCLAGRSLGRLPRYVGCRMEWWHSPSGTTGLSGAFRTPEVTHEMYKQVNGELAYISQEAGPETAKEWAVLLYSGSGARMWFLKMFISTLVGSLLLVPPREPPPKFWSYAYLGFLGGSEG